MLRFGPYCLDLSYLAEFRSEWAPKEKRPRGWGGRTDGRTYVRTDGWTDGQIPPVFYRTSSPSGPLPKKKKKNKIKMKKMKEMTVKKKMRKEIKEEKKKEKRKREKKNVKMKNKNKKETKKKKEMNK